MALDLALGGGIPRGRIVEIFGPEASGKTTLALHVIAEAQQSGGQCSFIDMEHALDPEYAGRIGVQIAELFLSQPDNGEQALEAVEALVRSEKFAVVVVDSVAALVPLKELEGDMGDSPMGMQARLMSQALRKLSGVIKKTNTAVVFTNQLRMKLGVLYGNPETTPGGMALRYYASQRLDIRRVQYLKEGSKTIGLRSRVRVVKNKVAPPFRVAEIDILFDSGISSENEIIDVGVDAGVIVRRGSHYYFGEEKIGQGREQARDCLKGSPQLRSAVVEAIRKNAPEAPPWEEGSSEEPF